MPWFDEVKPYFLVARAYGLAPYTFVKGVPSNSRAYRVLTTIVLVTILCEASFRVYKNATNESRLQVKILMALRALVTSTVFITEGISCMRCLDDVKSSMDHIKQYDRAFGGIDFATKSVVIWAWSRIAVAALYLPFLCFLRSTESGFDPLTCGYYSTRGLGWFAMVLKFLGVLSSLKRRFEHLSNTITKGAPCIVDEVNGGHRPLRLEDVGRLHEHLISATRKFNLMHNMVLFMWICEGSFFITLKMYALLNDNISDPYYKTWRTCLYLMPDVTIVVYLFTICHNTTAAANKIGWLALSPKSCVLRGRLVYERDEGFLIGQRFILQQLNITAGYGLFHVELPLLGTIIGAMTTVLVILCG